MTYEKVGARVSVGPVAVDDVVVQKARRLAEALAMKAGAPCHVSLQVARRLGTDPEIEATVSLTVHGAPVWAIAADHDGASAVEAAFDRVGARVANSLAWGGDVEMTWPVGRGKVGAR